MRLGEKFKHEFKWHLLTGVSYADTDRDFWRRISADRPYPYRTADCLCFAGFLSFYRRVVGGSFPR